ncbi:conserved hypothetical protein [Leishmania major strain Friedlin]|uniref:COPI associated protein n=1 Tax=Leishmania major TaxID=5664 RepID=Q4QHJ0_LEIMA|nr:conserved hypothetical protein [Leishmania major strain Friedlin]CAG9570002.1 COPI_associated_protein_-_putative [Leishmania major strain Friedlin]CAJ02456.1 conserved hypothetical protein [Leishmania major strain Friedlin]|eukprot:XP_001681358.1 conserved hypothetical protein [Leishmania major strain Friedlin]
MSRPNFDELLHSPPIPFTLKILGILGAFGCGTYVLFLFMIHHYHSIRSFAALLYLLTFSIIIPSAESGLLNSTMLAVFARFLISPMGRAFLYVFMGGVILGIGIGGWVVGVYLFVVAILNVIAGCFQYA